MGAARGIRTTVYVAAVLGGIALLLWSGDAAHRLPVPDGPSLPAARVLRPTRALVLVVPEARASAHAVYDAEIEHWRRSLTAVGVPATIAAVEAMEHLRPDVVVVPLADCLGEAARAALDGHLATGGGVILVGRTGSRTGACAPRRPSLVARWTGGAVVALPGRGTEQARLIAGAPLAAGIPAELSIPLGGGPRYLLGTRRADGYYDSRGAAAGAALYHTRVGAGAVAWLGFSLSALGNRPSQRRLELLLVRNAVNWAAGHRPVYLAARSAQRNGMRQPR